MLLHTSTLRTRTRSGMSLLGLVAVAHLLVDASASLLSVLLPSFQQRLDLTPFQLSLLVATFLVSSALSQPLLGAVADRAGQRRLAVGGAIAATSLLTVSAWAPSLGILVGLLVIGGLGSGAFHPAATTSLRGAIPNTDLAVGVFTAGGMLGIALGPLALLTLIDRAGPVAASVIAVPGAVVALMLWRALPSRRPDVPTVKTPLLDLAMLRGITGQLTLSATFTHLAVITFLSSTPLLLVADGYRPTDPVIALVLATFTAAAALGGIAGPALGRRFGRSAIVMAGPLAGVGALAVTLLMPPTAVVFWLAVAAAGALVSAGIPTIVVAAQEASPRSPTAAAGFVVGGAVGTAGLGYVLIGALQETVGLVGAAATAYAALIPAAWFAVRALRGHASPAEHSRPVARPHLCPCPA